MFRTTIIILILAATTTSEPQNPIIKQQNGIIVVHKNNVLIRKGTYHARITINISRKDKVKEAIRMKSNFHDLCSAASKAIEDFRCDLEYREIDSLIAKLNHQIYLRNKKVSPSLKSRVKRNSRGLIPILWDGLCELLTGSNTPDPGAASANSAGVIAHETKVVQKIENQLAFKERHVEENLMKLSIAMKKDEKNLFDEMYRLRVKMQLTEAKTKILDILHSLIEIGDAKTTIMESTEVETIIMKINAELKDLEVPTITLEQLATLSTYEVEDTNTTVIILIGLPVVLKQKWQLLHIIALPEKNGTIAKVVSPNAVVDNEMKFFLGDVTLVPINETLLITKETVTVFEKAESSSNCALRTITQQKNTCEMAQLPLTYDVWEQTPVNNMFSFYSNQPKRLECSGKNSIIEATSGTIELPRTCSIQTRTKFIRPSADTTLLQNNIYNVDIPRMKELSLVAENIQGNVKIFNESQMVDTSEMEDVVAEADSLRFELPRYVLIILAVMGTVIILTAIGLFSYCKFSQTNRVDTESPKPRDNFELRELRKSTISRPVIALPETTFNLGVENYSTPIMDRNTSLGRFH